MTAACRQLGASKKLHTFRYNVMSHNLYDKYTAVLAPGWQRGRGLDKWAPLIG